MSWFTAAAIVAAYLLAITLICHPNCCVIRWICKR